MVGKDKGNIDFIDIEKDNMKEIKFRGFYRIL
jgi:hypothetical protein